MNDSRPKHITNDNLNEAIFDTKVNILCASMVLIIFVIIVCTFTAGWIRSLEGRIGALEQQQLQSQQIIQVQHEGK